MRYTRAAFCPAANVAAGSDGVHNLHHAIMLRAGKARLLAVLPRGRKIPGKGTVSLSFFS
jgi:hypothetical protein